MNKTIKLLMAFMVIFANTASFGMNLGLPLARKNGWDGKPTKNIKLTPAADLNNDTTISKDLLIATIASAKDGEVKNNMARTCKYFDKLICKTNPAFVSMPIFTAHQKDMNEIALFFSWHNNTQVIDSLKPKLPSSQIQLSKFSGMWSMGGFECSWPKECALDYPGTLNTKYIENDARVTFVSNQLPCEAEEALLFAALSKNEEAVEKIAQKIKRSFESFPVDVKLELHDGLLGKCMERDDIKAFTLLAKHDPYGALNIYYPQDKTGDYDKPYLNQLIASRAPEKGKYVQAYKECGGKTLQELEQPKESCIIS